MRQRTWPLALAALAALAALSGVAGAAGGLITSRQIKDRTIQLRDLSPAAIRALKGQTGEQGPPGPAGPAGPAGPKGTFDPAKLREYGATFFKVPAGTSVKRYLECPEGSVALSGSYEVQVGALRPIADWAMTSPRGLVAGWALGFYNEGSSEGQVGAYIVCAEP